MISPNQNVDVWIKDQLKTLLIKSHTELDLNTKHMNRDDLELKLNDCFPTVLGMLREVKQYRNYELPLKDQARIIDDVVDMLTGLGPLDVFLNDPSISEIMINGANQIFIERNGRLEESDMKFDNEEHLMKSIDRFLAPISGKVTEKDPICDATLPDGSRVNVIIPPVVLNGAVVTIRRKDRDWSMQEYIDAGAVDEKVCEFLQAAVMARVNLVISGGTSTGKTTLVTALAESIPQDARIITIENVPELDFPNRNHWVRMVARPANLEGKGEIPLRALVTNALRMRPDRIILGEARGGEALDVVQAMHSGHDGFMTVLHGNTSKGALERMETLMLMSGIELPAAACRKQISSAVDLVVHMERYLDGSRRVSSIAQVHEKDGGDFDIQELFHFNISGFDEDGKVVGEFKYSGLAPNFLHKFRMNNITVPDWLNRDKED